MQPLSTSSWDHVLQNLKHYWGYDSFRPPQDEVVRCLIEKRDALILLPTGYGKSICFQIPALLEAGVTLVISPLVALMEDQVQDLRQRGLPAAALHGDISKRERGAILKYLEENQLRLLYLSPETLLGPAVWERLLQPQVQINGMIIDEAHTLVHWGESFRPDFRRLGAVRPTLKKNFPIAAFTATADPYAQRILLQVLQLRRPHQVQINPRRSHIHLNVSIAWTPAGRRHQIAQFIRKQGGSTGLIYARTRPDVRDLAEWLTQQGLETVPYHGGLGSDQRRQIERAWLSGDRPFLVCTNAFGMGINKPNVRWVLHYQAPLSPTDYIQEVGRGGRDGQPATALMLVSEPSGFLDPSDRQRQDFFLEQRFQFRREAAKLLQKLPVRGDYQEVIQTHGSEAKVALALLHQAGCLVWTDPFHFRLQQRPRQLPDLRPKDLDPMFTDPVLAMERLITTRQCRWQILLAAFGHPPGDPCGTCDNCRRKGISRSE